MLLEERFSTRAPVFAVALAFLLACGAEERDDGAQAAPPSASEVAEVSASAQNPSGEAYSEERAACSDRDPNRKVHWGELHIHSKLSMDAYLWNVRGGPDDVYRFAKGEEIGLAPLGPDGKGLRKVQLERPLDFAALTDHASFQGEVALCTQPNSPKYESPGCKIYRGEVKARALRRGDFVNRMSGIAYSFDARNENPGRNPKLCGPGAELCKEAMAKVWEEQQAAADRHYDRSEACSFTTFNAYEYTATPGMSKVHHNVIFRNNQVPDSPIAWVDHPDVYDLWKMLKQQCIDPAKGCDVLTLPHNSNLSNGRMFVVTGKDLPVEEQRERAQLRADLEPLVEISQIKGDSECRNNMYNVVGAPDEFCNFEEWRDETVKDCKQGTGTGALAGFGCVSRLDYVRNVLVEGLRERQRLGVNPYKLGVVAATDGHNANPGDVAEYSYPGWRGDEDDTPIKRLGALSGAVTVLFNVMSSPGGLAGVWSEENSRDSLFDAMERREVFGTSGPRMTARFFGSWNYPSELCGEADLVSKAYAGGVPMGGDLPARPSGAAAPTFIVTANRDPGIPEHPGGLLQRVQVIKGWLGDDGKLYERVYDVAGGDNGASVDLDTCQPKGPGAQTLCRVWTDPKFDAARDAVYYVRVLENPSCRWSQIQCNALPEAERPVTCTNRSVPTTIQERLWTSPIWYEAASPKISS